MLSDLRDVFGRRLREQRRSAGLTQIELAERLTEVLGASRDNTMIARTEMGTRPARLDEAVGLAEVLGVPLAALITERDPVDVERDELERELREQEARADEAEREAQQARIAAAVVEQRLQELNPDRTG